MTQNSSSEEIALLIQAIFTNGVTKGPIHDLMAFTQSISIGEPPTSDLPDDTRFVEATANGESVDLRTNNGRTFRLNISEI